jgi:hypothetical protein
MIAIRNRYFTEKFHKFLLHIRKQRVATESSALLNELGEINSASHYLEIGVEAGRTFEKVNVDYKVAVDPNFLFEIETRETPGCRYFQMSSDEFFDKKDQRLPGEMKFDLVYIDGFHTYSQTKRDFINVSKLMSKKGIILIDDTIPSDSFSAESNQSECYRLRKEAGKRDDGTWHGDVFKLIADLSLMYGTGLEYATIIDLSNPKTVVWTKGATWNKVEIKSDHNYLSYEDLFGNGIPNAFHPLKFRQVKKLISQDFSN